MEELENKAIEDLSYEEAMSELETIVQKLERAEVKLEESVQLYERGVKLSQHCSKILQEMQGKISQLRVSEEGEIVEEELRGRDD